MPATNASVAQALANCVYRQILTRWTTPRRSLAAWKDRLCCRTVTWSNHAIRARTSWRARFKAGSARSREGSRLRGDPRSRYRCHRLPGVCIVRPASLSLWARPGRALVHWRTGIALRSRLPQRLGGCAARLGRRASLGPRSSGRGSDPGGVCRGGSNGGGRPARR